MFEHNGHARSVCDGCRAVVRQNDRLKTRQQMKLGHGQSAANTIKSGILELTLRSQAETARILLASYQRIQQIERHGLRKLAIGVERIKRLGTIWKVKPRPNAAEFQFHEYEQALRDWRRSAEIHRKADPEDPAALAAAAEIAAAADHFERVLQRAVENNAKGKRLKAKVKP